MEDEKPKGLWAPMGVVDTSTSRGRKFLYGALYTMLERHSQGLHIMFGLASTSNYMLHVVEPKKRRLGPQNDPKSLGLEKL